MRLITQRLWRSGLHIALHGRQLVFARQQKTVQQAPLQRRVVADDVAQNLNIPDPYFWLFDGISNRRRQQGRWADVRVIGQAIRGRRVDLLVIG